MTAALYFIFTELKSKMQVHINFLTNIKRQHLATTCYEEFNVHVLPPHLLYFAKQPMWKTTYLSIRKQNKTTKKTPNKKPPRTTTKKPQPCSILFWFLGFCCHFILKCCFLTFASTSLFNVIFHLNCLLIVCAALAEHD